MTEPTRRAVVAGAGASVVATTLPAMVTAATPAVPAQLSALGEAHMRIMLEADLVRLDRELEYESYSTSLRVRRAIAWDRLVEFDRGAGVWLDLGKKYPSGLPVGSVSAEEERLFRRGEGEVGFYGSWRHRRCPCPEDLVRFSEKLGRAE